MKLLTKQNLKDLPKLYATENTPTHDKVVVVRFFLPSTSISWYAVEYSPEDKMFFGYVDNAGGEWGYFSLTELESIIGKYGLGVERDMYFPAQPFSEVVTVS
tara:strand:+ start:484 stop:789 length:306 start_codon:yes stop_codon:yes gene_type:complete